MNLKQKYVNKERQRRNKNTFLLMGQGSLVIQKLPSKSFIKPEPKKNEAKRQVSAPKKIIKTKTIQEKSQTLVIQEKQKEKEKKKIVNNPKQKGKDQNYKYEPLQSYGQHIPLNIKKEKQLFFESQWTYNPVFIYSKFLSTEQEKKNCKYRVEFTGQFLDLALKILEKGLSLSKNIIATNFLTLQRFQEQTKKYIAYLGFEDVLDYKFVQNSVAVAETSYNHQKEKGTVKFTIPIKQTPITYEGILNHQIGTHFLRTYNDIGQVWHGQRKDYRMEGYLETQEGLATLNTVFHQVRNAWDKPQAQRTPVLFYQHALRYLGCHLASRVSFCQLFRTLYRYAPDPVKIWNLCVRMKRGATETEKPGGSYKIQVYFNGAVKILKNRNKIDFRQFHCGKFSLKDYFRLKRRNLIQQSQKTKYTHFLEDIAMYKKCLDALAAYNGID